MKKTLLKNTLRATGILLLTILLATCDVGLGPSVDTTAPEITISSPSASAILKGTLNLSGTASDDGTISSVKVKLKGISSSNTKTYEYDAVVDATNKKWSLSVDSLNGEGVKDGNYEITVTAKDDSEKVSYRTTTFYVDNTAPVIMVDNPDVKQGAMNYDVQLEGKVYDQSDITSLTVVICNTSGAEVIRKNANVTNNSAWKITFDGDSDLGLANGNPLLTNNGTYYYYVVATDSVNNTSEYFFHTADVYTRFTARKLDMGEWASFDKGDLDAVSGQQLDRSWFNSIKIPVTSITNSASLNLVPNFNYSENDVAGIDWGNIKEEGSSLAKDASIVGSISRPSNVDSPFVNNTFKCYIFPALNNNIDGGNPFVVDQETGLVKIKRQDNSETWEETPSSSNVWPTVHPISGNDMITLSINGSGRNFSINTGLPDGNPLKLKDGACWIYIEIENSSGTKFFGYKKFEINPGTPTLRITTSELSENLQTTINTNDYAIRGTSFTSSGYGCDVAYKISNDGETIAEGFVTYDSDFDVSGKWSLPFGSLVSEDGVYSVIFTAEMAGLKAVESRTITIDRTAPDLNITGIEQVLMPDNIVRVTGSANDTNSLRSVKYRLTPLETTWHTPAVKYNWVYDIPTASAAEIEHTFEIEVVDMAGNTAYASTTVVIDNTKPELTVVNGGWSSKNVQSMTGTAEDPHFSSLSVTYKNSTDPSSTAVKETIPVNATTHEWTWAPNSNIADGVYDVTFVAKDEVINGTGVYETEEGTCTKETTYTTSFTLDQYGPVIEEVSLKNGDITELGGTSDFDITVRASDSPAGLKKIEYRLNNSEENPVDWISIGSVASRSTITLSGLPEGNNTIEIKAIDKSDNETLYKYPVTDAGITTQESVIKFVTDYNEPQVWFGETSEDATDLNVHDDVWIKGKLTDGVNTDKMKEAKLTYTRNGITTEIWSLNSSTSTGDFTWNNTGTNPDYKWQWKLEKGSDGENDGRYTFKLYYKDINDNSGTKERTVVLDTTGPNISFQNINVVSDITDEDVSIIRDSSFTIKGTATDDASGIGKIIYTIDEETPVVAYNIEETPASNGITLSGTTWSMPIQLGSGTGKLAEGEHTIQISAVDSSGNATDPISTTFMVDLAAPVITIDAVNNSNSCKIVGSNKYINGDLILSGTVNDSNPLSVGTTGTMTVTAYVNGSVQKDANEEEINYYNKNTGTWSFTLPADSDGLKSIRIEATDAAGRKSEVTESITVDKTAPIVTITNPGSQSGNFTLSADAYDTGKGVKIVKYALIENATEAPEDASDKDDAKKYWQTMTKGSGSKYTAALTASALGAEGEKFIYVKASDELNESDVEETSFYLDTAYPILNVTLSTTESYTKEAYELSISASDANLRDVVITKNGDTWKTLTPPSESHAVNETVELESTAADGRYTFTITATDGAEKSTIETANITIDKTEPTVGLPTISNAVVNGSDTYIKGNSVNIEVEASDTGAGVKSVVFTLTGTKSGTAVSEPATATDDGNNKWIYRLALGDWDEGNLSITAKVTDKAGNVATTPTAATFKVDKAKPTVSPITVKVGDTAATTEWLKGNFTLSGTVSDTLAVAKDGFKLTINTSTIENSDVTFSNETTTGLSWEYTYDIGTDESGVYEITVEASDKSGQSPDPVTTTVRIDKSSPEVSITSPDSSDTPSNNKTGKDSLSGDSYTFRGESSDTGSGIAKIKYAFVKASDAFGSAAPASPTSWTEQTATDGSWSISRSLAEGSTGTPVTGELKEGHWYLFVKSVDKAGNESTESKIHFHVDKASPTLTVTPTTTYVEKNGVYYFKNDNTTFAFSGTVSDTYGIKSLTISTTDDGSDETTITLSDNGNWNHSIEGTDNSETTITIKATDLSDKTATKSYTIYRDTVAPTVTISSPANEESFITKPESLTGTISDVGSGVESILYDIKKGSNSITSGSATITGASWSANNIDIGEGEGTFTLTISANDKLNNGDTKEATFYVDTNNPTLSETGVGTGGATTNTQFTLSGWIRETNELNSNAAVTISADKDGFSNIELAANNLTKVASETSTTAIAEGATHTGWYYWTKTFYVPGAVAGQNGVPSDAKILEDGTYVFTVTAKDVAGKTAVIQRTVKVDTTVPTVGTLTISNAVVNGSDTYIKGNSVNVEIEASDTGVGVNSVVFNLSGKKSGTAVSEPATATDDGNNKWTYRMALGDWDEGDLSITATVTDKAGNVVTTPTAATFKVDKAKPTIGAISVKVGDTAATTEWLKGNFTLSGTVSDTLAVAKDGFSLTVKKSGSSDSGEISNDDITFSPTPINLYYNWEYTYDIGTDESGVYEITVEATDKSGQSPDPVTTTVRIDKSSPEVSITSPDSSDTPSNNKTGEESLSGDSYTFRGVSSDTGSGIAMIKYAFVQASDAFGSTAPASPTSWTDQTTTDGSWSISRSLAEGSTGTLADDKLNEGHWYLFVKSVDKAGNESTESKIHFHVDKASPTLTVTPTTTYVEKNGVYYFKNDNTTFAFSGTVSDTYGIKSLTISTTDDGSDETSITPLENGSWECSINGTDNSETTVTIKATDLSDKVVPKSFTIYRDTVAPIATISSPEKDESFITKPQTITGTISDVGSGVDSVSYTVKKGEETKASGYATITGASWTANNIDIGEGEGTFTLTITANDKLNNEDTKEATFFVDTAKPTLSETGVGTGGATTNSQFTLSGWINETNGLNSSAAVTISADKEGFSDIELAADNLNKVADGTSTIAITEDDTFTGWYYWTKTFYVPGAVAGQNGVPSDATILDNGTYVFTITAKDVAGKTSVVQRTVNVDTTAPVFTPKTENGSDYISYTGTIPVANNGTEYNWLKKSLVDISVKVDDETNGSGINTVEYETTDGTVDENGNDVFSTGVLRKVNNLWTASVPLSDGENEIRIKATDVAGNVSYYPAPEGNTPNYETIRVDTTAPAVTVDSVKSAQDNFTNAENAISFYLNIAETGSGIASVTATLGSGNDTRTITLTNSANGVITAAENNATITVNGNSVSATHKITISAAALSSLSGSKMLTVKAADNVGNESISVNVANITIDTEDPTIENLDFNVATGNPSYVSAKNPVTEGNSAYYVQGGTFRITGRSRDNIGIEKTEVKVGSGTNAQPVTSDANGWSFETDSLTAVSGSDTTITVAATDKAGNTATKTIELTFDTTAPVPKHILDSNAKDLVFRVGNYDNDERPNGSTPAWDSKDEDVGGKYSKETYGNTRTITLRGYYKDEESGLSKIYYKFYDEEKINLNSTEINNLIDDVVAANQYFTPTAETTKRVFYKVADGATNPITDGNYEVYKTATASEPAEYYTEITTNFVKEALGPLNGLKDNENFLVLVAEDNVGNRAVDYAEVPNENGTGKTTYYNYVLNVDTIAPSVPTVNSITYNEVTTEYDSEHRIENLIVNKNLMADGKTIDITLTATDVGGSNVKSVELTRIGNTTLTYKDSHGGNGVYTVKISKNDVETGAVSVRITDNAGNAADFILFSITNDSDAPTVSLSSHSSDTIVNKKITLKGTAEDANGVDSVVGVYYTRNATLGSAQLEGNATLTTSTDASTGWVKYNSTNQGGSNSWSILVDTEAQGFTDNVDHYFTVAVKDKAGNIGYSNPIKLTINQLSDCPVIRLSNITTDGDGLLVSTQTLFGTIEDDDGTIENIYVYVSDHELTRAEWESIDWVSYSSVKSGAWSYQIKGNDGLKFLYFRVSDKYSSTPFTTPYNRKAGVDGVYMIGTDETEKVMKPLQFTIDMNPPQINPTVKVYSHTSETDHKDYNADDVDLFTNNMILGGTKKYVDIYVSSFDTNQISKMTVQISGETIDDNNANMIVAETTNKKDGVYDIFVRKNIDVSGLNSDSYQLTITAYDKSSYNSVSHNIRIDNEAPRFDVESLKSGDKVIGDTVLRGTAIDTYAGIKSISYMIPTNNTTLDSITENMPDGSDNLWFPMTKVDGTSSAWKVEFIDRSKETDGKNNQLATFVTGINAGKYGEKIQTNSNIWKLPILFRTEDSMGNATVIGNNDTYFYLQVDPDGDKPTAEITYPAMADKNTPVTLGGTIRIFGGANDNIAVSSVFMQIDADGDGDFNYMDKTLLENMKYTENGSNKRIYNPSNGTTFVTVTENTTFENGKGYVFESGSDSWWGIKVNGKENWNLSINEHGEFNEIYGDAPSTYDANTTYYTRSNSKYTKVNKGDNFAQNYPSNYENYFVKIPMHIRVRALDNNNKVGDWDWNGATDDNPIPVGIKIDTEGPQIDNLRLIQYADDNTTVTASQDYKADISIKGTWYLTGHISDNDGIKTLSQNSTDSSVKSMEIKPNGTSLWQSFEYDSTSKIQDADFRIKFETAGSGNLNFTITAKDDVEPENTSNFQISVKYDNSKPAIGVALTTNGGAYAIGNGDEPEGTKKTEVIQQSNGEYTIEGIVTDGNKDSGSSDFSRLAVYFMREGDSSAANENLKNNRIYNPELTKVGDYNRTYIYDENDTSVTGNVVRTIDDLPIFVAGVTKNSDSVLTLNSTSNSADHIVNIRKGGLVRIKGVYRLITDVSDDNKTVTFDPPVDENFEQAEFVYALIIDNRKMETAAYEDGVKTVYNDDGDKVIESVTSTNSLAVDLFEKNSVLPPVIQDAVGAVAGYKWTLTIDSKNIPDGPIYICCVAFDNAGNVSELQKIETRVFNSRPAIANIWLGTDYDRNGDVNVTLDNDGKLVSSELVKIRSIVSTTNTTWKNNAYTVLVTDTDGFTAVGNTVIRPEIVGGNGTLNYYYKVTEIDPATGKDKVIVSDTRLSNVSEANAYDNNTPKKLKVYNNDEYVYVMETDKLIKDDSDKRSADDSMKQNSIVLMLSGDDGADTKLGGDTNHGLGNGEKQFHFKIYDSTENLVGNNDDITKNSSQWASFGVKINVQVVDTKPPRAEISSFTWNDKDDNSLYGKSTANGHIELPNDWKNSAGYDSNATSGEYDLDPKVSGKITIRGTADDETCLQSIWIKLEDFDGLYATKDGAKDYVQVSAFSGGSWTPSGVLEPETQNGSSDGYHFYVTNNDTDLSDGHHVEWALDLDTSRISGVVGLDKIIQVKVLDTGKNDNTMAADNNGDRYIDPETNKTAIDQEKVKKAKLQMDVVPYITDISTGDMDTGTKKFLRRSASGAFVASVDDTTNKSITVKGFNLKGGKVCLGTDEKATTASGDNLTVAKNALTKSGNIKVVNGSVETLNNVNSNGSAYNKEASQYAPNHTDDRYIYMWDTTTTAYSGTEAVMKPVIGTNGAKTGDMMWYYASNAEKLYANNQVLCDSWGGAIVGGNFAYNDVGTPYWVYLHNTSWTIGTGGKYQYYGSVQWGKTWKNYGKGYNWNTSNNVSLGLGNLSFEGDDNYSTYNDTVMNRYQNIKVLTTGNANDTLNMVAYFDKSDNTRSIVFWRFHEGAQSTTKTTNLGNNSYTDITKQAGQTGSYSNGSTKVGMRTPKNREELTSGGADSKYFDMAYDSVKNVVYIAYYDEVAGALKMKYLNNPSAGSYGKWTNSWSNVVEIDPDAAGQYIAMKTDGSGNVHLAYYDSTGSYLKYALVTPTGNAGAISALTVSKKVLVDTLFTNGMYNSITLKEFGSGDVRPVITSYSISYGGTKYSLRTSWPLTAVADIEAGADADNGYTGKWETVVVVSTNAPAQENTYTETKGTGYTGNIVIGYTASKLEQAELLPE